MIECLVLVIFLQYFQLISKAYDCLPYDLMVAKLEVYGLAKENVHLISDYLSYRKQRTKIGSACSDWAN